MQRLVAGIAAILSVVVLTAVLATRAERSEAESASTESSAPARPQVVTRSTASTVPCAVPMSWNVVRVDSRFDLDSDEAVAAVAAAAASWEEAVGRDLFRRLDSDAGSVDLPVRFVFDERQERGMEQQRAEEALDAFDLRLEEEYARIQAAVEELEGRRELHRRRTADFEGRLAAFNDTIRGWNEAGGAPDSVRVRLSERSRSLDAEAEALQAERDGLNEDLARIEADREAYDRRVQERNRRARELMDAFPESSIESGLYREAVGREDGRVVSVEREVRVYRFGSRSDLVRIAAHELGHALGLGHSDDSGALMYAEFAPDQARSGSPVVADTDVELLRSRCPAL